ncbi:uncharacterized protein PHACADRAFT_24958 [Phanerochaete carnosa HHB-10118-sp]|uniref:Uncharacterized protein n=1 Tax=Phanerochaete carnosa (strain HHB-10118-sp) TaxID=650164 RepID=K5WD16_PHACS|nr:uncharacterized protein PHACADRAFT_24958 [Phanerochaete carnosa HHB-10118-sp]EKM61823.1 hypothetical protein PHACADRAFT_24958 [Phanerochaete carnosa HHB-10118-sp]
MVATWCVLASLKHNQLHQPQLALLPRASSGLREDSPVTGLRLSTGVHIGDLLAPAPRQHKRELSMDASAPGSHIIPVLARMVAADLKYTLSAASGPGALPQERRTLELFNVLQALTESITDLRREPWFVQAVENVLRASTEGSATPKLAVMFPVACRQVKFTSQGKELGEARIIVYAHHPLTPDMTAVTSGQTSPTDYESLILYYFERRLENPSEQTLNMFVFSCVRWLRERRISDVHSPVATTVLQRMGAAARVIAQLRAPRDVHGYDGADDGEWIKLVRHQYKDLAAEKARARVLRQLFHAFETAYRRGVLAGHQGLIRDMIHEGLKHTHEDLGNICTDRKCPWVKHKCQGEQALLPTFQNCPLLQKDVRVAPNSVPAKLSMSLIEQKRPVEVVIPPGAVDSVTSGTVRFLPADDLRLPLLHQALSTCKITYDRLDNCLALSPGSTSAKSLEKLLLEYFPGAAERYSEESINMFILTAVRWLDTQRKIEHRASATVTDILGRMVLVAEAVRQRERRSVYGCDEAEDYTWLAALLSYRERLVRTHGSIFRRLLHVFEDSFRRGVLVGPETWIAFYLHGCLESGHEGLSVCEDESCCWIRHECSDGLWKRDCALLHPIDSARGQNAPPAKTGSLSEAKRTTRDSGAS